MDNDSLPATARARPGWSQGTEARTLPAVHYLPHAGPSVPVGSSVGTSRFQSDFAYWNQPILLQMNGLTCLGTSGSSGSSRFPKVLYVLRGGVLSLYTCARNILEPLEPRMKTKDLDWYLDWYPDWYPDWNLTGTTVTRMPSDNAIPVFLDLSCCCIGPTAAW